MLPGLSPSICQARSPVEVEYASGVIYKQGLYTGSLIFSSKVLHFGVIQP